MGALAIQSASARSAAIIRLRYPTGTFSRLLALLLAFVVTDTLGCSHSTNPAADARPEAGPITDDDLVRECVTEWLAEQEAARSGAEFWDDYARTLITEPDLSPFAEAMRSGNQAMADLDADRGRRRRIPATIVEQQNLFALRSWKLLDVKLIKHDEDRRKKTRRNATAVVKARIDSSDVDGSLITKVWTIGLFKNGGQWGIYSLSSPSRQ